MFRRFLFSLNFNNDYYIEPLQNPVGRTVLLPGKSKFGTSRIQLTKRKWELLKFTFIHEHFPSSVHMARLAKMMGTPWVSQAGYIYLIIIIILFILKNHNIRSAVLFCRIINWSSQDGYFPVICSFQWSIWVLDKKLHVAPIL